MSFLGPTRIFKLASSGSLVAIGHLDPGIIGLAKSWTDGRSNIEDRVSVPPLLIRAESNEFFWLSECEQVAEVPYTESEHQYVDVPFAQRPKHEDFLRALDGGTASTVEKERYIRTRIWWIHNDPVRNGRLPRPLSPDFADNLLQLRAVLDVNDDEQCRIAAEVHRELGDFNTALALLRFQRNDYGAFLKGHLRWLCHRRIAAVQDTDWDYNQIDEPESIAAIAEVFRLGSSAANAKAYLLAALDRHPQSTALDYAVARLECSMGDTKAARQRLSRVFSIEPSMRHRALDEPDFLTLTHELRDPNWCL